MSTLVFNTALPETCTTCPFVLDLVASSAAGDAHIRTAVSRAGHHARLKHTSVGRFAV